MWLLNTSTAEQKFFADPSDVPRGYAILSHVWDNEKDTFQSVRDAVKVAKGEPTLEQEVAALKKKIAELEKVTAAVAKATVEAIMKTEAKENSRSSVEMCPPSKHRCVLLPLH